LGALISLPRIERFDLTDEPAGPALFHGSLRGNGLEKIARTGWSPELSQPVQELPIPENGKQRLKIVMPWPAPAPHAPIRIWLRDEAEPRLTNARF
jgi:hypothetical protein